MRREQGVCCVGKQGVSHGAFTLLVALGMEKRSRGPRSHGGHAGLATASILFLTQESLKKDNYLIPSLL